MNTKKEFNDTITRAGVSRHFGHPKKGRWQQDYILSDMTELKRLKFLTDVGIVRI